MKTFSAFLIPALLGILLSIHSRVSRRGLCVVLLGTFLSCFAITGRAQSAGLPYILDMVHNNPGEPLTQSAFNDPAFLKKNGYTGQVINDFTFIHAAITYNTLNPAIFPEGSESLAWVQQAAKRVRSNIQRAHEAGIKVYYFTDLIVLPKQLVNLYRSEICDSTGRISLEKPRTIEVLRIMLQEIFTTFPDLDGLVIRTGETYLNNVPYHTGNNPITHGPASHIKLLNLLRDEVCVKRNKMIFYRTWSFGGMHDSLAYYLQVTDNIPVHPNLIFSIKHTRGDYHRTFSFNPTLGKGHHAQIVEVECQREYEGKGAFPNYVMDGVINGFEEYHQPQYRGNWQSLTDIKNSPNLKGIWSWSRGGGWVGPYITNEFWPTLNAYVISHWAQDTSLTEEAVFNRFMDERGIKGLQRKQFRRLCLLAAQAVLRGHASNSFPFDKDWVWWTRDEFLSGIDSLPEPNAGPFASEGCLYRAFSTLYQQGLLSKAVTEKYEAVKLSAEIEALSKTIILPSKADQQYLVISARYGALLHQIIATGWDIMALGFAGDRTGKYDHARLTTLLQQYDQAWANFQQLKANNPSCATLYRPYAFVYRAPDYYLTKGMGASVNKYRQIAIKAANRQPDTSDR